MRPRSVVPGVLLGLMVSLCWARPVQINGIGIATIYNKTGNRLTLVSYTVVNNAVTPDTMLRANLGGTSGVTNIEAPVINTFGTHIAFVRTETTGSSTKKVLSVMKSAGADKAIKDICQLPSWNGGALEWPKGTDNNWIYFMNTRNGNSIMRANVQTGVSQEAVTITGYALWWESITWDAQYFYGYGNDEMQVIKVPFPLPSTLPVTVSAAVTWWKEGCGHCIGPTGAYQGSQIGTGHTCRVMVKLASPLESNTYEVVHEGRVEYLSPLWSAWEQNQFGVGVGINWDPNTPFTRFSRNSDKWQVLSIGWTDRWCGGGCNMTLMNHVDSASLNVSRIPSGQMNEGGCLNFDFWLQSPLADVCAPLQNDVSQANRDAYTVSGLGGGQATVFPAEVPSAKNNREFTVTAGRGGSSVDFREGGIHSVAVFDASGACVFAESVSGRTAWIPGSSLRGRVRLLMIDGRAVACRMFR